MDVVKAPAVVPGNGTPPTEQGTVGTACAAKEANLPDAQLFAAMRARLDALKKVCGSGKQTETLSGTMKGNLRYFVDDGRICATGLFQVACGPESPAAPFLPEKKTSPKDTQGTPATTKRSDVAATKQELEAVAREAEEEMEAMRSGGANLGGASSRAEKAFAELDDQ